MAEIKSCLRTLITFDRVLVNVCNSARVTGIGHSSILHPPDWCSALRLRQTTQQGGDRLKSPPVYSLLSHPLCFQVSVVLAPHSWHCQWSWFQRETLIFAPPGLFWRQTLSIPEVNNKALTAINEERFQSCFSGGFQTGHWIVSKGRSWVIA